MTEDKKYGFEEVDNLSSDKKGFKKSHILYVIFFTLSYFYLMILLFDLLNEVNEFILDISIMLYVILLLLIIMGFSKSIKFKAKKLESEEKENRYVKLMNEKCELEQKYMNILNQNPNTLADYIKAFLLAYGSDEHEYHKHSYNFKRLLYLNKKISSEQLHDVSEPDKIVAQVKEQIALENKFKSLLNDESATLKNYIGLFLSTYGNEYPVHLYLFKKMMLTHKNITSFEIEEEIKSYFFSIISNKSSFKSIYGVEPIYDFTLIHEFIKKYRNCYSEDDLENLSKLMLTKGIRLHSKELLEELVLYDYSEIPYRTFSKYMQTKIYIDEYLSEETKLEETVYLQKLITFYQEKSESYLPMFHRFLREQNLTSLDYKDFEENMKIRIFELNLRIFELNLLSNDEKLLLHEVDVMDGYEFETFVGQLYQKMGYSVEQTPLSNDQGADLIISKYGERTAVQVKNYTSNVPNSAVQQVVASKNYYGCSSCIVVTNSYFSKSAIELADANGVKLVDRDELNYIINQYN